MGRVLVTGGCGYIGSHVTRQLHEAGREVVVVDDLSTGFREALLHGETLVEANLGDEAALDALFARYRFDAVIHFAASIIVPESVEKPLAYYDNNTVNTLKLLRAVVKHGVGQFVFSSTAAVYGDTSSDLVREDQVAAPTNPYGRSKLMDEWIVEDVSRAHGLRHVILRYFNVAGADLELRMGQRSKAATHLIKGVCEAALGRRPAVTVYGTDYDTIDGTGVRDYIHVEDLASAHLSALRYLEGGGESTLVNCGYGHGLSVRQVIAAAERVLGRPVPAREGPRRPGDVAKVVADVTKIKRLFDWTPRYDDLELIVRSALDWEQRMARG